ncbi:MAG: peroxisome assembly protein (Peroxin-2) [Chaenotheca gracillima]|nr:MAG: peroxisome assembly protein (Peroxin-2) [Chaenotheca gracillima]
MTDFSAAQQRLAARRRLNLSEIESRVHQSSSAREGTNLSRPAYSLNRIQEAGRHAWSSISGREGTRPVFRVGQVDAELLDEELLELLRGQVGDALKFFGSHLRDDWRAEILLGLRAVLFKVSVWDHNATYGAALQNLKFTDARKSGPVYNPPSRTQKALYGLFTVFGQYSWNRWEDYLVDREGSYEEVSPNIRRLSRLTSSIAATHSFAAFVSFLIFLVNGRYRTVLDRILRLRLAPPTNQVSREVSFEYLNRQLVWHAFTEFLLFVLPLVGIGRWRRWLSRAWRKAKSLTHITKDDSSEDGEPKGELAFLPERTCAICYQDLNPGTTSENEILAASGASGGVIGSAQTDVTNPYEAVPCGCIYCFVCLAQRLEAEEGEGWVCLRCGEVVKECQPWAGDVAPEVANSGSTSKMVGFSEDRSDQTAQEVPEKADSDQIPEEEAAPETTEPAAQAEVLREKWSQDEPVKPDTEEHEPDREGLGGEHPDTER